MATIYEMTKQAMALYELLCSNEIDEKTFKDTLEAIGVEDKINSYCEVIAQLKADAEACKAEKKRLDERSKTFENSEKRMKSALEEFMLATGKDKAKTDKFTLYHTTSTAVNITDLDAIPDKYIKPRKENDVMKSEIAKSIKNGEEISGAILIQNKTLVIR